MTPREKTSWLQLYALEFGLSTVLMFIFGLTGTKEAVIAGGATIAGCMALLTLVLLFRITYLKGRNSR